MGQPIRARYKEMNLPSSRSHDHDKGYTRQYSELTVNTFCLKEKEDFFDL